jgi:hypothetical protein
MTTCTAILANRRRCELIDGHGGRHRWVDLPLTTDAERQLHDWLRRIALFSNDPDLARDALTDYRALTNGLDPQL